MKKTVMSGLVLAVILSLGSLSFAEEMKEMEGKGSMKKGMMMGQMMMKGMEKSVTATSDGGVVVVTGNKITKYDKDLNVVKEVETKMDMEAMKSQMEGMMKMCPMMGDMNGMEGESEEGEGAPSEDAKGGSADDHSAHH